MEGRLPGDKPRLLAVIDRYLEMPGPERLLFQLGRRLGLFQGMDDLEDLGKRARAEEARGQVQARFGEDLEHAIRTLAERFI